MIILELVTIYDSQVYLIWHFRFTTEQNEILQVLIQQKVF